MPGQHESFGWSSGGTNAVPPEQPIPLSLTRLRQVIEELSKTVSIHGDRIEPVLKPGGPEPGELNKNGVAPGPPGTTLSNTIDGLTHEIKSISDRLASLTNRLGLE